MLSRNHKRKLNTAFGEGMHDSERYGREIEPNYFLINMGHNVIQNENATDYPNYGNETEDELIDWCKKYLEIKMRAKTERNL